MRLLFVKESLVWPRISGHHVHTYYLLRALAQLGHEIALVTHAELDPKAIEGLSLTRHYIFDKLSVEQGRPDPRLAMTQEFFHRRWGIDKRFSRGLRQAADEFHPDAVVTIGWKELAYLSMLEGPVRIWYAGDDPVRYSLLQALQGKFWVNLRLALSYSFFERAFRARADRVWVVSGAERPLLRWLGGMSAVDIIPNGVDAEYYRPGPEPSCERACVFWGRLDFAPNIQALEWFCQRVWPLLRRDVPEARFAIYGFKPTAAVEALAGGDGIELIANLPDLRSEVRRYPVVVLPFRSGGGIKNKLLEAASMGKAIVCSPQTTTGLCMEGQTPLVLARGPQQWARAVAELWNDSDRARRLGQAARKWVIEHHDWRTAARLAVEGIECSLRGAKPASHGSWPNSADAPRY